MTYPEHEKLKAVKDASQAIGEFIEWLGENGYHICERQDTDGPVEKVINVPRSDSKRSDRLGESFCRLLEAVADNACIYWPTTKRLPNALLAEYFGINERKLDDEKRAMLDEFRVASG